MVVVVVLGLMMMLYVVSMLCCLALQTLEWILGDTFMKQVYSVFDLDKKAMGFALAAPRAATNATTVATPPAVVISAALPAV